MAERVRRSHVVGTDDTVMPMQEPGRGQVKKARLWVYLGDEAQPYNVFDFTESRGRDGPRQFLGDCAQVLVADANGGYDGVVAGNDITPAGCWAHAQRKFGEAEATAPGIAAEPPRALTTRRRRRWPWCASSTRSSAKRPAWTPPPA